MDEKTEELRSIFVEITDEETVTERQEESRGSLAKDGDARERLGEVVAEMRDRYEFDADCTDDQLVEIVEGFYAGMSDTALADELGISRRELFRARLDLHLLHERDTDAPFDLSELRNLLVDELSTSEMAERLDVAASTVRRYRHVVESQNESRRASDRYRSEFEDALGITDRERLTSDIKEDGLEDATAGTETNVSF